MSNLSCFMAQNAIPVENVKFVASKRFVGAGQEADGVGDPLHLLR